MFSVTVHGVDLPIFIRDYKGVATVADGSDNFNIVLSTGITKINWTGMWLILTSGNLKGYMGQIASSTGEATTTGFGLAQELPSTPSTGSNFKIISLFEAKDFFTFTGNAFDLTRYMDSVSFATSITVGYTRGTVNLKKISSELANIISELMGSYLIIADICGRDVFHGIIVGVTLDGDGGQIECIGIGETNGWYQFFGLYDESETNTSTKLIREILSLNPWIDQKNQQIDNTLTWDAAQQLVGGIGPLSFIEPNVTVKSALDKVLAMGNYGLTNEDTKSVYLQGWDYGVPYLAFANPSPEIEDAQWVIGNRNLGENKSGLSLVGDIAESYSYTGGSYNAEDSGTSIETAGYTNLNLVNKFGIKKREVTSGQGRLISFNIMRVAAEDKNKIAGPGKISIEGNVRAWGGDTYHAPYLIRAGDVIIIEDAISGSSVFKNDIFTGSVAQVGTTSYSDGKMTIGLSEVSDVSEIFKKQIEVDVVA